MLLVAEVLDELLSVNWLTVRVQVSLTVETSLVDKEVSISNDTGNSAQNVIVNLVQFTGLTSLHKKLGHFLLFSSDDNTCIEYMSDSVDD